MLKSLVLAGVLAAGLVTPAAAGDAFTERGLDLKSQPGDLKGTLTTPAKGAKGPVVLILAGSGPTDRDGNSPIGVQAAPYRLLAHGLAERGVTSLRVDKRGIAASMAAATKEEDLRFQTYSDDARAWAAELKRQTGAKCVWLVGHSEGALVAEVAAQDNKDVCGVVLISGAGRKAADVLREQLTAGLPQAMQADAFKTLAELEAGRTVANPPPALAALFRPSVQPYLISWLPLDPAELVKTVHGPVLIVQGTTDIQIGMADAERLAAARSDAKLVRLEGVNHVLKVASAERAANQATYADPNLPLAPGVVEAVADFVKARR
ncbi:alpha/beta hydrolase [Caulobacter sp. 17J80-11]|uniref:alpha/beta hydrolase n=1 Tax=Caulobacter sp. 17J80-11 TaxID=2763502 RepID=UPI0016539F2D|nr:alpha/beta fold hydrolase [Caulobacter sp. 17J80-11]MBC6981744.1 alpha/beta fold hydrolase [Caulobacter sp. 17J80-11]